MATTAAETVPAPTATLKHAELAVKETGSGAPESEEPEPQNALTSQFSEKEWEALKAFRKQLPDVLADAYPDKKDAKTTPVTLWGVQLNPNGVKSAKESVVLMKFLRARNLSAAEAREMLVNTLRWRESFKINDVMEEQFDEKLFGNVGHIYGKDREGRPVVYNFYGGNTKNVFSDVPRFIRWRIQFMEKCVQHLDFEKVDQMVQVHDYEGVGMRRTANTKNAASEATNIFGSHYPELLHRKLFVNVPSIMTWVFWLFKPLISANTIAKMSVVGSGPHAIGKALLPLVDVKEVPKKYGGEAENF